MTDVSLADEGSSDGEQSNTLNTQSTNLLIIHLDVGQGESTLLVEMSFGTPVFAAVIDGGHAAPGRGSLIRHLNALGVKRINYMICSHFDADHTRGLTDFIDNHAIDPSVVDGPADFIPVDCLYVRCDRRNCGGSVKQALLNAADMKGIPIEVARADDRLPQGAWRTEFECFHSETGELLDENGGSLAWRITFGLLTYYTAGDLPIDKEDGIAADIGRVDCMKCGHHGSKNSTSATMLETLNPTAAILSSGRHSYGHPSYDVIERLAADGRDLRGLFATNCFHNRRCFGHDYGQFEYFVVKEILGYEFVKAVSDARSGAIGPYGTSVVALSKGFQREWHADTGDINNEIAYLQNLLDDGSVTGDIAKHVARTIKALKAIRRSVEHMNSDAIATPKDALAPEQIGFVAGEAEIPGTVTVNFPMLDDVSFEGEPYFYVGFHKTENAQTTGHGEGPDLSLGFRWFYLSRSVPCAVETRRQYLDYWLLDYLKGILEGAVFDFSERSFAISVEPQSPGAFEPYQVERKERYAQFSLPTLSGMADTERSTPYVPFCAACRIDIDADDALFELIDVHCRVARGEGTAPAAAFHRGCLVEVARAMHGGMDGVDFAEQVPRLDGRTDLTVAELAERNIVVLEYIDVEKYLIRQDQYDWVSLAEQIMRSAIAASNASAAPESLLKDDAWPRLAALAAALPVREDSSDEEFTL